jgi:hypothetical protein
MVKSAYLKLKKPSKCATSSSSEPISREKKKFVREVLDVGKECTYVYEYARRVIRCDRS